MRRDANTMLYLIFPAAGVLLALRIPADNLPLRLLVVVVVGAIGVLAADAGFHFGSLRASLSRWRALGALQNGDRVRTASWLMAGGLALMIASAVAFSPTINLERRFTLPVALMLGGMLAIWAALRFAPPETTDTAVTSAPLHPPRGNLRLGLIGILMLLGAAEYGGGALGILDRNTRSLALETLLFYGGIGFLVMGLSGLSPGFRLRLPALRASWAGRRRLTSAQREWLFVLGIFAGALAIRLWNLETGLRLSADEATAIEGIGHYITGNLPLVSRPSAYITTLLFPQWQAIVTDLFGRSYTTLRLPSALVGALTVVVTYCLARDLFLDRKAGAIAALILMTFPPHVHFSRISLLHIADPLFGTLAVWFLVRGIRSNHRLDWALAGASLGLTQYFFEAGKLFYVPLALLWLGAVAVFAGAGAALNALRRLETRPVRVPPISLSGVLIAVLAFVMAATPAYYAAFSRDDGITPRLTVSGGFDQIGQLLRDGLTGPEAQVLAHKFLYPFTVYVHQPERPIIYGGDQPLMLIYVVPFFLMGMAYLLWRWRSVALVIPLWILATGLTNGLLRDSDVYARWHVVFPAVAVVVAAGLRYPLPVVWAWAVHRAAGRPMPMVGRVALALVPGLIAFIFIGQLVYYYGWHVPLAERQFRLFKPYPDVYDLALRSIGLPDSTDIYLIGDPVPDMHVPRSWINFLTTSDPATLRFYPLSPADFGAQAVRGLPDDRNLALFVDPRARDTIELIRRRFGCTIETSPYPIDPPDKAFALCFVPRTGQN